MGGYARICVCTLLELVHLRRGGLDGGCGALFVYMYVCICICVGDFDVWVVGCIMKEAGGGDDAGVVEAVLFRHRRGYVCVF